MSVYRNRNAVYENPPIVPLGGLYAKVNDVWTPSASYTYSRDELYKGGNRCWDYTNPGPPYRVGYGLRIFHFNSDRLTPVLSGHYYSDPTQGGATWRYDGGFISRPHSLAFGSIYENGELAIETKLKGDETNFTGTSALDYGAQAWNKFKPGAPTASLGVFLAELRDLPRMLKGTAKFFYELWKAGSGDPRLFFKSKELANHWLNHQFGWMPFLSDMRRMHKTYVDANQTMDRIISENGKWVKRHGTVMRQSSRELVLEDDSDCGMSPILPTSFYSPSSPFKSGSHKLHIVKSELVWFEARFRYYIPEWKFSDPVWKAKVRSMNYGLFPTPSVVWEATPWSWLADWVGNFGDVVANLDPSWAEQLVAKYAYVMKSTAVELVVDHTINFHNGPVHHSSSVPLMWKTRGKASPFGFALDSRGFSAKQWSILAALGISKYKYRSL